MSKTQKYIVAFSAVIPLCLCFAPRAGAMHIMEGYLPARYCVMWGALCVPFLAVGVFRMQKIVSQQRKTLLLLALAGAFSFLLSALKIPSITGASSHPTGTGFGAILFGPAVMTVIGGIVLLFQAVLLAHGGLTTLGANMFSMAVAGPLLAFGIYRICKKLGASNRTSVFLAACLGDLFSYCVTSLQLAVAYPDSAGGVGASMLKFITVFAVTQIPLAIIEGLLTAVIISGLETWAKPELRELGFCLCETKSARKEAG